MAPSKNVTSLFLLRLALALLCASSAAASTSDGWSNDCQAAINNVRGAINKYELNMSSILGLASSCRSPLLREPAAGLLLSPCARVRLKLAA